LRATKSSWNLARNDLLRDPFYDSGAVEAAHLIQQEGIIISTPREDTNSAFNRGFVYWRRQKETLTREFGQVRREFGERFELLRFPLSSGH
jgi:hypothetical protein